jgi:hypothetical protein
MIKGAVKTEKEYRAVEMNSSSSLKEFSLDRKKYYKRYILNEKSEEKDSSAATIGRLVETLLLEKEEFENRFYLSGIETAPTGLMLAFVEALCKYTDLYTNEDGELTKSFKEILLAAYTESGFKWNFDTVVSKFTGSNAELYYNEIISVKVNGYTVVTVNDVSNAERIVAELQTNPITSHIVNTVNSARWEVFNQFQIQGYEIDGLKLKSMIDKLIIDHDKKTIQIYDLKCTWSVENFYEEYYLYRRSYIQAYLYHRAILNTTEFQDYEVLFPKFIVCDSINYFSPLVYTLNAGDMNEAYNGFVHKGKKYPGVKEIIDNLKWAIHFDIWNISKKNHLSGGVVNIKS